MRRWPETIRVFLDFRMICVGCPVARIHDLDDACLAHGIAVEPLLAALGAAVSPSPDRALPPEAPGGGRPAP